MNFTTEQIKKAKTAKTAEELLAMANAENYEMTAEEAQKIFAELHKQGELTDDELIAVAGGSKDGSRFDIDDQVTARGHIGKIIGKEYASGLGWLYSIDTVVEGENGVVHPWVYESEISFA